MANGKKENDESRDSNKGFRVLISTIGNVGQIGFTFAFSVLISVGIGYLLDNLAGTERVFKLLFLFMGILAGGLSAYKSLQQYISRTSNGEDE